jgi:AcrR family transcriptional regulator
MSQRHTISRADAPPRLTTRGATTRSRIVSAAAELICAQGVGRTTLDAVIAASAVSKSQLYRHFPDKSALVRSVIDLIGEETMRIERKRLETVDSLDGLRRWRDAVVATSAADRGRYGCSLGALAVEVSAEDALACAKLDAVFQAWRGLFETLLSRLRDQGLIPTDADIWQIATGFVVTVQGGYLIACTVGSVEPLGSAIDLSIDYLDLLARVDISASCGAPPA